MSTIKSNTNRTQKLKKELDTTIGNESTKLNNIYKNLIVNKVSNEKKKERKKWVTYNQIVVEFNKQNWPVKKKELQYNLTDKDMTDPKQTCLNALKPVKNKNEEFKRLYSKIKKF